MREDRGCVPFEESRHAEAFLSRGAAEARRAAMLSGDGYVRVHEWEGGGVGGQCALRADAGNGMLDWRWQMLQALVHNVSGSEWYLVLRV